MSPEVIINALFGVLPLVGGLVVIAIIGSLLFGAMLINGKKVPAILGASGPAIVLIFVLFLSAAATNDPAGAVQGFERFATPISLRLLAPVFVFPPAIILGIVGVVVSLRSPSRDWKRGLIPGGIVAIVVAIVGISGVLQDDMFFSLLRGGLYVLVGLIVVVTYAGVREDGNEGYVVSTVSLVSALFIGAVELGSVAMREFFVLIPLAKLCPNKRDLYIDGAFSQHISAYDSYTLITFIAAIAIGLYGVYIAFRKRGGLLALSGIIWVGLVGSLLVVGRPSQNEIKILSNSIPTPELGMTGRACD